MLFYFLLGNKDAQSMGEYIICLNIMVPGLLLDLHNNIMLWYAITAVLSVMWS